MSNSREVPSDVTIQDAREGAKGSRKRCKQRLQEAATVADNDGGSDKEVGSTGMVRVVAVTGKGKRQAWPPTDHFEKLLEETSPNHAYPIKHKLRDCSMMKNFMASGSLNRGMEVDEVPDESDVTPFPRDDVVMMIYDGRPSPRVHRTSNLSPRTLAHYGWGVGMQGCKDTNFQYLCTLMCVGIWICTLQPHQKQKRRQQKG
jgi:hypothetical protein